MTQQTSVKYIVAYGFSDKFKLTEPEAQALMKAAESGAKIVKFQNRVFSTNFTWIMPIEDTREAELDSKELELCEELAEWLSRDVNGLDWNYESALGYSKRLMERISYEKVNSLWKEYALGAYPSVKRFMSEAKQTGDQEEETLYLPEEDYS